jgi:hypothetical protein
MGDKDFADAEAAFSDDPEVIKAQLGAVMRTFWNSEVGKLLEQRAIEQKDDGIADMLEIDPVDDVKAWRAAKLKVLISEQFMVWVGEVLQEGEVAIESLAEENDKLQDYRSTH